MPRCLVFAFATGGRLIETQSGDEVDNELRKVLPPVGADPGPSGGFVAPQRDLAAA
jgi:hypothetical protein